MLLSDLIISYSSTAREVVERLEAVRTPVVYVVKNKKLYASVSNGDVRRFCLANGDMNGSIDGLLHLEPLSFLESKIEEAKEALIETNMPSIPIINRNKEIVAILLRGGSIVRSTATIDIPVVITAGGKGTRLYPYTKILPKALIPIGDIPITELIIRDFAKVGAKKFYMIVNHKKNMIESYYDGIEKDYELSFVEETKPLGTGGGLGLLKGKVSGDFFFSNCDIMVDADYSAMVKYHEKSNNLITMVLAKYRNTLSYGIVDVDSDNNYIKVKEKPTFNYLINTGLYIVNSEVIKDLDGDTKIDFPEIIDNCKKKGEKIGCYIVDESSYMDMGCFEELDNMKEKMGII